MAEDEEIDWENGDPVKILEEIKKRSIYMKASRINEDGECYNLLCPRCGCDQIVADSADLGTPAKCYECGHQFTITENCWKFDHQRDDWKDLGDSTLWQGNNDLP